MTDTSIPHPIRDPETVKALTKGLRRSQAIVKDVNERHGWYEEDRTFGDSIALLHSELSEALEEYRDHGLADTTMQRCHDSQCGDSTWDHDCPTPDPSRPDKPEGHASEAADVLVRLLDHCERFGIDLAAEFIRKVEYNDSRPYRHGNKLL